MYNTLPISKLCTLLLLCMLLGATATRTPTPTPTIITEEKRGFDFFGVIFGGVFFGLLCGGTVGYLILDAIQGKSHPSGAPAGSDDLMVSARSSFAAYDAPPPTPNTPYRDDLELEVATNYNAPAYAAEQYGAQGSNDYYNYGAYYTGERNGWTNPAYTYQGY